jgi:RNA polymerase sigma-70 factor (ECF subfamily)
MAVFVMHLMAGQLSILKAGETRVRLSPTEEDPRGRAGEGCQAGSQLLETAEFGSLISFNFHSFRRKADVADRVDELLPRAVGGDRQALTSLLEAIAPDIRAILSTELDPLWRSQIDLDDLLQTTYLEAFLRIRQFTSGPEALKSWLVQIGRNNLRDAIRELTRAKRPDPRARIQHVGNDSHQDLLDLLSASSTTPSGRAAKEEQVGLLKSAIRALPASYRSVVQMFDLEGRPVQQIASALQRSEGAVYMLRARAHDRLREILGFSGV